MKHIAITSLLALTSAALFAGDVPYVQAAPMSPAPQPTLWNWFAGGGVGYLTDAEEEMYSGHIGIDLQQSAYGCGQAIYLEVGYINIEETFIDDDNGFEPTVAATGEVASAGNGFRREHYDLDIIPITLNYKLECPISGPLSAYVGAGAGIALLDVEFTGRSRESDDDTTFYAQVFAGLLYNASESFEVYAGGRWIYIDSSTLFGDKVESQDDFVVEVGGRFNF